MFKKCIALLTAFVLLLTPMTAGAVTWGDIMTGIDTTGSFSGGGTTAVKEGIDTITVSGGEVEFEYDKLGENYYKSKDTISKDGTYVFSKVTLTSTDSLSIPIIVDYGSNLKDSIKVKLEDSVTLNSGVDVGLFDPDGTIILENYADIKGGTGPDGTPLEAISIHISDATGGTAKFEMKGNGTLSSGSYPVKATYYVVVDNTEDDTTAIKNAFLNQIDLASIQNTQQLYAFEEGEGGQYRLILFDGDTGERKTTDSASLGLSALATTTPEVPSETPIPEQPDTTP
ncbi:MAG: hypothetical protein Q4G52_08560, partial [Clostridia bacterium]|nr:hypothetical protein [Clostridia bacterium]